MSKFNAAMPTDSEPVNVTLTRIMDALKSTKEVDEAAVLQPGLTRGKCVIWSTTNQRWEAASGATLPGDTDVIGIVEYVDPGGTTGTVRLSGVYTDASLAANTAYYCQADGSLGSTLRPLYMGRTTEAGQLCMPSLGGGSSAGGGGVPLPPIFLRWNPFTNTADPKTVTDELHTIQAYNDCVVKLNELPLKESPSTLTARVRDTLQVAIDNSETKIQVKNIGWHSVNEVLTVESEQMLVGAVEEWANSASLAANITSTSATSCTVNNGAPFAIGQVIKIDSEEILVGNVSGTTLSSLTRGYNGTTAATHSSGATIYIANTLTVTRGHNSTAAAAHLADTPVFIEDSMSEVGATPAAGEFWPDYSSGAMNFSGWNSGKIKHNPADEGKVIAYSYRSMGKQWPATITTFTESGTFVVPPWATVVYVSGTGPGTPGGNSGIGSAGAGGGAGDFVIEQAIKVNPGESITVTINSTLTSFGAYLSLAAGVPGGGQPAVVAATYDDSARNNVLKGGMGQSGPFGSGGKGSAGGAHGGAAKGYGAGGGGAAGSGTDAYYGGAGAPGFLLVRA